MESRSLSAGGGRADRTGSGIRYQVIVALVAAVIFFGCIFSPPSLMDDVDAVQAQIAQNMLQSGDWVTARLDGVKYLEKSPMKYWMIAVCFMVFGVHDWAARIPIAISTVLLCWVVARFAAWAFGRRAGMCAGIVLATSVGLFLFTRILIPDVILTLAITVTLWGLLRAVDEEERHPTRWAMLMWASMGVGLLLKGLIAAVFPVGAGLLYLGLTHQMFVRRTWKRLRPFTGILLFLVIAAPWHVLATIRNPPYFDFTMHSERGSYRGFFWFYFINEHVLRFLNLRYPRDYNTVPRLYFWLFHLLWLFPWSVYFPALFRLSYRKPDRASRVRLMALCWTGFILVFFTFSTTQEYYSMPCYPALALLLGSAIASGDAWLRYGTKALAVIATTASAATAVILWLVRGMASPGDISEALKQHPSVYTLSLGHMLDLTLASFAYLRLPLALAGVAFAVGAVAAWRHRNGRWPVPLFAMAVMMVLFFHAARLAMVVFDPYMSSRPLAEALLKEPPGTLVVDDQYYTFSSVFFYTNRTALLLNGRVNNLVYGSYAPDAPKHVFIGDAEFQRLWQQSQRYYLLAEGPKVPRLAGLVGTASMHVVKEAGGKYLFSNQ
ncbi:MAG TPA: glycosyltransferase family 39 protein [Bryobacteraceae bacterium]|nr:glycosyltransferase family 39 protein [Bryobacteraceae bacterium]